MGYNINETPKGSSMGHNDSNSVFSMPVSEKLPGQKGVTKKKKKKSSEF